jgi:hypothetical protein
MRFIRKDFKFLRKWEFHRFAPLYMQQPAFAKTAKDADRVLDKLYHKVLKTFDQVSDTRSLHISLADIQKFQLPSKMVKREAELSIVGAIIVLMLGPMGWIIDKAWSVIFDVLKAHVH